MKHTFHLILKQAVSIADKKSKKKKKRRHVAPRSVIQQRKLVDLELYTPFRPEVVCFSR